MEHVTRLRTTSGISVKRILGGTLEGKARRRTSLQGTASTRAGGSTSLPGTPRCRHPRWTLRQNLPHRTVVEVAVRRDTAATNGSWLCAVAATAPFLRDFPPLVLLVLLVLLERRWRGRTGGGRPRLHLTV